jgi:hypothetical protein
MQTAPLFAKYGHMSQTEPGSNAPVSVEEILRGWSDLTLRVQLLEAERTALEQENKNLKTLVERVVEHRKKSHSELVTLLTVLVSKLPINDVGVVVSRLVEHSAQVNEVCAALINGKTEDNILQPAILKTLEITKRNLVTAVPPLVEELIRLQVPLDTALLQSIAVQPENFFSPSVVRASRGFVKGQVPRERIIKEYGEAALVFFKDVTTDVKFNPRPKPDEIMLAFVPDFETLCQQHTAVAAEKRTELFTLYQQVRQSRGNQEPARSQKLTFLKLSFVLELIHYYDHQSTESPDVVFAQRLPPLIEQLVLSGEAENPNEELIRQAEALLAFVVNADYRQAVVNNFGKGGGLARTLRFILTFRATAFTEHDPLTAEFVKHLLGLQKVPSVAQLSAILRLVNPDSQRGLIRAIFHSERLRREDAENLGRTLAAELGLPPDQLAAKVEGAASNDKTAFGAWDNIKELIARRAAPGEITAAIRKQLHAKYDADEVKQSWLTLSESDPMSLVRVFSLLPYLPDGQTDPIARPVLETYVQRLMHEKYVDTYNKVVAALKNLFKVKADSPALINFLALVKWVDPAAAARLAQDIGIQHY